MPPRRSSYEFPNPMNTASLHNDMVRQVPHKIPSKSWRPLDNRRMIRRQQTNTNTTTTNQTDSSNSTMVNQTNSLNSTIINQAKANTGDSNRSPGCFSCVIEDNSPLVHYEGVWVLSGSQFSTTHSTTVANSSVSLRFNGSGIVLFGTVPASNETTRPPTAVYLLDDLRPFSTTLPRAAKNIPNQPLFASSQPLSSTEEHVLVVNVKDAETPFTVEKFFVVPRINTSKNMMVGQVTTDGVETRTSTSTKTSTKSSATFQSFQSSQAASQSSQNSHKILGVVLGSVFFLLIVAVLAVLAVWRKRRAARDVLFECPAAAKARPDTIYTSFTSTESILRNESALWSPPPRSQYSRSDGRNYSRSASDGRSIVDGVAPPLPPKPVPLSTP